MNAKVAALAGAAAVALVAGSASAANISACLITKTDTNPFFVKMKEGATAEAKKLGITLKSYAGKVDGDNQSQVNAIETCIADGAKGILITPSDTKAIVPTVEKARKAGLLVIALDTPLDPVDAADMTFATDNFQAGKLIGEWAKAEMGDKAKDAKIAMLDLACQPADRGRAARPGLPDRLRHRRRQSQEVGRRDRSAHRRPRGDRGQRGRRPQGDGDAAGQGSGHQPRLYHQRARRRRRLPGAEGRGEDRRA